MSKSLQKVRQLAKCVCQARQKASKGREVGCTWCDLGLEASVAEQNVVVNEVREVVGPD